MQSLQLLCLIESHHKASPSKHHDPSTTKHHKNTKSPYHPSKKIIEDTKEFIEISDDQDVQETPCKTNKGEELRHGEKIQIDCNTCQCLYGKVECTQLDCTMADPNVQGKRKAVSE